MKLSYDASLCTGCKCCELVCSAAHTSEFNPRRSRIRVYNSSLTGSSAIHVCHRCTLPMCVKACTYDACKIDPTSGIVHVTSANCVACLACVDACPFKAIFVDPISHEPIICDGCSGDPKCVKFCYKQAIFTLP